MTDRIVVSNLRFEARHGVHPYEKTTAQRFELDVELELDLEPAGLADDLALSVDYGAVARVAAAVIEAPAVDLLETLAERVAAQLLGAFPAVTAVTVRVRKPDVRLAAPLDHASVEIRRTRRPALG